jgi:hypothetical protein
LIRFSKLLRINRRTGSSVSPIQAKHFVDAELSSVKGRSFLQHFVPPTRPTVTANEVYAKVIAHNIYHLITRM